MNRRPPTLFLPGLNPKSRQGRGGGAAGQCFRARSPRKSNLIQAIPVSWAPTLGMSGGGSGATADSGESGGMPEWRVGMPPKVTARRTGVDRTIVPWCDCSRLPDTGLYSTSSTESLSAAPAVAWGREREGVRRKVRLRQAITKHEELCTLLGAAAGGIVRTRTLERCVVMA